MRKRCLILAALVAVNLAAVLIASYVTWSGSGSYEAGSAVSKFVNLRDMRLFWTIMGSSLLSSAAVYLTLEAFAFGVSNNGPSSQPDAGDRRRRA
jgi:hypothetical protein